MKIHNPNIIPFLKKLKTSLSSVESLFSSTTTWLLLAALTMTLQGCATGDSARYQHQPQDREWEKQPPVPFQGRDQSSFESIQKLYQSGRFTAALNRISRLEESSPTWKTTAQVQNLYGLIYLGKKMNLQAANRFKKALRLSKNKAFDQFIRYNLATAQYEANLYKTASVTLGQIKPNQLDLETRMKFHYLEGLTLHKLRLNEEATRELFAASHLLVDLPKAYQNEERIDVLYAKLMDKTLDKVEHLTTLESIYDAHSESPFADLILFEMGSRAYQLRQPGKAEKYLAELVSEFGQSPHYTQAAELLRKLQNAAVVNAQAVGVLLPLSGRFARFGKRALQGVQLAFRIFSQEEPDSRVTLYVEDSGDTVEKAIQSLDKLYYEHNVAAVIGPLLSKGIEKVTERAQELGVPMISLAQQSGHKGDYVFQSAVTVEDQAREIARQAVTRQGLKKIAIMYPNDKFGQEYMDHFWDAVEKSGGQIVGIEPYPSEETDFRTPIDKLVGLYYKEERSLEKEELAKFRKENNITTRNRRNEKFFKLPPIVDFDAVFIPDEAKAVSQILPTFAYRDVEGARFLGVSTWNSAILIKRARKYAQNSLFVDTFFLNSPSPEVRQFIAKHEKTFGSLPTAIEALAFDAASVLEKTLLLSQSELSRREIRNQLSNVRNFPGVTGKISYFDGQFRRDLRLLSIIGRQIKEVN